MAEVGPWSSCLCLLCNDAGRCISCFAAAKSLRHSAEEVIQWLGASDALAEDPALAPSTQARQLTPPLTPDPGNPTQSSGSQWHLHSHAHPHIHLHTYTQLKIKTRRKIPDKCNLREYLFGLTVHCGREGTTEGITGLLISSHTSALRKQRGVNAGDQLAFSFSSCQENLLC